MSHDFFIDKYKLERQERVPKAFEICKLFLQDEDPGYAFEMSEWFNHGEKKIPEKTIILVKLLNGEILKAVKLNSFCVCTWEEGFAWSGKDIEEWVYIRKIDGEDREDVTKWSKVRSEKEIS